MKFIDHTQEPATHESRRLPVGTVGILKSVSDAKGCVVITSVYGQTRGIVVLSGENAGAFYEDEFHYEIDTSGTFLLTRD